jgi:hypothetical protein
MELVDFGGNLSSGFFVLLAIALVFEVGIFIAAYLRADTVSCNWLWCEFTTVRKNETISKTCYENGALVNCSQVVMR